MQLFHWFSWNWHTLLSCSYDTDYVKYLKQRKYYKQVFFKIDLHYTLLVLLDNNIFLFSCIFADVFKITHLKHIFLYLFQGASCFQK